MEDLEDIVSVAAGYEYTVGLCSDGTVVATGDDSFGQYDVQGWTDIVSVVAGEDYTLGLRSDGTVVTAGYDSYVINIAQNWRGITAISVGYNHVAGLHLDGTVVAAGDNSSGQCDVENWTDIVQISTGDDHTAGLRADGTVVAVGDNTYGQCDVADWSDITAVDAGPIFTAGLRSDGTVITTLKMNMQIEFDKNAETEVGEGVIQWNVDDWDDIIALSAGGEEYDLLMMTGLRSDGTMVSNCDFGALAEYGQSYDTECKWNADDWVNLSTTPRELKVAPPPERVEYP